MTDLFESINFCGIDLRNRFVRSATMENMSTADRLPRAGLYALYGKMAAGRIGLIITSAVRPNREWDLHPQSKNLCIDTEKAVAALAELTERVHADGSKIAIQLGSLFRFGGELVAPSPPETGKGARALSTSEIKQIIVAYAQAAKRSLEAGFDAVQINAAHGFPLSQFLSPAYNHRDDPYGGSTENRARMIGEMIERIKERTAGRLPVFIKMNVMDFIEGGITVEEAAAVIGALSGYGLDAVEASGGGIGHKMNWLGPDRRKEWHEGYLRKYTGELKSRIGIPVVMVGGLRSVPMMEQIIRKGEADLVAMSRPFIREPQLIKRWLQGDRAPAACISCNGCMQQFKEGKTVRCVATSDSDDMKEEG
jgi:2,4-dienoyl-CoA reductase-like NADH-dependent reductase (Old Yellow Enzyme family)